MTIPTTVSLPAGFTLSAWAPGMSVLKRHGRQVATLERSKGGPTPQEGAWFAYATPSHADMMAAQHDRAAHAHAWGRTRKAAAAAFVTDCLGMD
ncbi:hypothetical protein NSA19_00880 [Actinomyces bowdenii]|uniref:hypothetical protein n=1 Tax=Actinomyces bowdenii TaxID=131109 RepID=UPI00214AD8B6|nr:hypothetical protein [Actinomyces bowdenii]MCR2051430.1 hypothetical protein [Actinomyces bowdenii]